MTPRRRAFLLLGLAVLLGTLAASDVAGREAALRRELGPTVAVVVAARDLPAGEPLRAKALAVRRLPARFAPAAAFDEPGQLEGLEPAADISRGTDLVPALFDVGDSAGPGAPVRRGERVADVVAVGSPELVVPGARVDVLITRDGVGAAAGDTELALEDVEVLFAQPADPAATDAKDGSPVGTSRVAAGLRVTVRQAVLLAAAQAFARELRLLVRPAEDRRHGAAGLRESGGLGQ